MAACSSASIKPLEINPCSVLPGINTCQAVPINQYLKPEYERIIMQGDICLTPDDYSKLKSQYREIMIRCGDKCQ